MNAPSEGPREPETNGVTALRNYRAFFHNAADPILVTDRHGRIVDSNAAMASALGYGPDELTGVYVPQLYAGPEEGERFRLELSTRDHVRDLPLRLRRRDGEMVELWFTVTARRDSRSRVVGYQAIARDVTEERRAVRRLQESERHFRELIEHSSDLISLIGVDGRFQYQGPTLERILGYQPNEILGRNVFEFVHPDDVPAAMKGFEEVLSNPDRVLTEELRFRHRDGTWRWLEATGRTLTQDGRRIGIVVNSRDVTSRREAQRALRESEESLRELFDSVPEMIFIQSAADRTFLNVNRAACEMFGRAREDLVGMTPPALAAPEQEETLPYFHGALRGETQKLDWRALRADGTTFLAEMSLSAGRYMGQDVVIGVGRDVTEQRRLENRLLQAQKLEAVGRLAGGVAHDFNNVLTAILGNAQILLAERADDAQLSEDLTVIYQAAQRASALTRQLLAFGRQQIIRQGIVDLNDVVRRSEALLQPLMRQTRDLDISLAEELPNVEADPGQLEQVLLNLVMNAVDATEDDGRIRVTTSVRAVEGSSGGGDVPSGLYVVLRVEDDGTGMTPEVRAQAFEPFFTTRSHGSGLGLSTIYGIARQSGGQVLIDSRIGAGTRVDVLLPVSARSDRRAGGSEASASGGRILLVEDEPAVRSLARRVLERAGYDVAEAADGEEALAMCETPGFLESIDLMVSDVVMPGMIGTELAASLRGRRGDLPVVLMSGHTQRGRPDLDENATTSFLPKPFPPETLAQTVDELLRTARARHGDR